MKHTTAQPIHLLELGSEFGPGPETDGIRCGVDLFSCVMTVESALCTCVDCLRLIKQDRAPKKDLKLRRRRR